MRTQKEVAFVLGPRKESLAKISAKFGWRLAKFSNKIWVNSGAKLWSGATQDPTLLWRADAHERERFDAIAHNLGSGNRQVYAPFNKSLARSLQPQSCWGVCAPRDACRCVKVLYFVGQMAGLTPRYHALGTAVQRTPEAASAYGIAARLAALAGRTDAQRLSRCALPPQDDAQLGLGASRRGESERVGGRGRTTC